ncbi:spore coat protein [Candidatus Collierbacteria bacterium RIFCSPLOWO2_01_FULL_50_23]|uniref:glucose-1-phosphate thymidylyltransferase n=2 Tax=Candidatus Collieribacteriota TaxID=1752725 RepID=A0A1F5ERF7_9BACT|nr:MAG: spore coat protein [Candidatus Collierbacteria bacterium RIFCSPHIGHO2_02_FULL_49_10]OGD71218.1 MAG: spore coat protein [Candidatus Collierbacteria bacterium RIFCSPHIGHO2_01_FULL_50_25]OGD73750.1 MAG: spore coat protein [Candidatus Collierbacteria bacterium RIFCSPLOWO2_01_FULL_50_23]
MKGVITAGGLGTRLRPLTYVTNKHLLPVYDKPMIYRPIETLVRAGIDEIMLIVGGPFAGDFIRVLKNGEAFGLKHLEYAYQEGEGGIADALRLARSFADNDNVTVILGDNCTNADISEAVREFRGGAMIFLKEIDDPERFGVATIEGGIVKRIVEKPQVPESNLAVTGVYIYDPTVFDKIDKIKPSPRGELEITDLNNQYLEEGQLRWSMLEGYWSDAGSFETLAEVNAYWARKERR